MYQQAYMSRQPVFWVLRDRPADTAGNERRKRLAFHVKAGDYFGTLAGVLKAIEEDRVRGISSAGTVAELLKQLQQDLAYLQEHYRIEDKKG